MQFTQRLCRSILLPQAGAMKGMKNDLVGSVEFLGSIARAVDIIAVGVKKR